ncbi:MAG TPA: helix-turn-helix transcriptional regulator [Myxococcota bacterium]|nr:helix-turn-helix transcriptional regulator [Myxococcota bacterium]
MKNQIPLPVDRALKKLGRDLSLARRRRKLSQDMLAERLGTSVSTIRRMEDGHPGIAIQYVARAMQVFGELDRLNNLIDTAKDDIGLVMMDEKLPVRVRTPRPGDGVM